MNKLVVKEFDYINGNTAIDPKRKVNDPQRDKQYEDLKRSKIDRDRRLKEKHKKNRRAATQVILAIFVLGIATIWRDVKVYTVQAQLTQINSDINEYNAENEALKAELLKVSSLDSIKSTAESKLGMIVPGKDDILKTSSKENYFAAETKDKPVENKDSWNLLAKIKEFLF
ncbi:septum formation initiator family protein [Clostridium sp. C8-1-8]|uniref:septum formation initiator family protein n=1 Tax=Clostridium sp. C8-1-8 TaxID=2698831 RepID=UPI00136C6734|nr:septum formation initiator family protein [Clostridium sp. C8-1-8]